MEAALLRFAHRHPYWGIVVGLLGQAILYLIGLLILVTLPVWGIFAVAIRYIWISREHP